MLRSVRMIATCWFTQAGRIVAGTIHERPKVTPSPVIFSRMSPDCTSAFLNSRACATEMKARPDSSNLLSKTCWLRTSAWLTRSLRYTSLPPRGVAPVPILVQNEARFATCQPRGRLLMVGQTFRRSELISAGATPLGLRRPRWTVTRGGSYVRLRYASARELATLGFGAQSRWDWTDQRPYPNPFKLALMAFSSLADSANWAWRSATRRGIFFSKGSPSSATSSAPT